MAGPIIAALITATVAILGWFVNHALSRRKPPKSDKDVILFFLKCFDRPAFKTQFDKEVSDEDFIQAIEDTITAINTGKLLHRRDRTVLAEGRDRHQLSNDTWRREMARIESLLQEIRSLYRASIENGRLRVFEYQGHYYMPDRDANTGKRIDELRTGVINAFKSICREAGVQPYGLES
jgi:hypothetical protein